MDHRPRHQNFNKPSHYRRGMTQKGRHAMANERDISAVFNVLVTNYGYIQRDKTPEQLSGLLDIWKQTLCDMDGELLRLAALKIISTSKWFPSVAELREAALSIAAPEHQRTGIEAWGDVVKAIGSVGYYRVPEFDDELVAEVVRSFGWRRLCASEDMVSDRARFIDGYNAMRTRLKADALMLPEVQHAQAQLSARRHDGRDEIKRLAEAMRK